MVKLYKFKHTNIGISYYTITLHDKIIIRDDNYNGPLSVSMLKRNETVNLLSDDKVLMAIRYCFMGEADDLYGVPYYLNPCSIFDCLLNSAFNDIELMCELKTINELDNLPKTHPEYFY